jgi:transcriptional regulator with XRE-family HTH domain
MLPLVSAVLTIARAMRGLTIPEVAVMAGVTPDDVFDAENFLQDVHPATVQIIARALGIDLRWLDETF